MSDLSVCIVTPTFNVSQHLETTIKSVLAQDYPRINYVIMDGGSTDGTVDVIRKYEHRLAYWISAPDAGQSDAINRGWTQAPGDVVAWINGDDYYLPGAVREATEYLRDHPDVTMVYGLGERIDPSGRVIKRRGHPFNLRNVLQDIDSGMLQATAFMRRQVLEEVGFLDVNLHYSMDFDLWLRIGVRYPPVFVPRLWARMMNRPEMKTYDPRKGFDLLPIIQKFYAQPGLTGEIMAVRRRAFAHAYFYRARSNYLLGSRVLALRDLLLAAWSDPMVVVLRKPLVLEMLLGQNSVAALRSMRRRARRGLAMGTSRCGKRSVSEVNTEQDDVE